MQRILVTVYTGCKLLPLALHRKFRVGGRTTGVDIT